MHVPRKAEEHKVLLFSSITLYTRFRAGRIHKLYDTNASLERLSSQQSLVASPLFFNQLISTFSVIIVCIPWIALALFCGCRTLPAIGVLGRIEYVYWEFEEDCALQDCR